LQQKHDIAALAGRKFARPILIFPITGATAEAPGQEGAKEWLFAAIGKKKA
jgi:hypothetical protein